MDLNSFISGSLGGFAGVIVSYPFDTIKVRIQNQHFENGQYKGALDCFVKSISSRQSMKALYRGMSSPLVGSMFINSILFGVESNVRKNLDFEKTSTDPSRYKFFALSGAIAGLVQGILITPIELIKIKMQLVDSKYTSTWQCAKQIALQQGNRGLARGLFLSIYREMPASVVYFVSFEVILDLFDVKDKKHKLWHLLLAGGTAGCLSWLPTYPIDVLKTRFQASDKYTSIKDCYIKTYAAEGYKGFWRGLSCTLMRAFPYNSACFATVAFLNHNSFVVQ